MNLRTPSSLLASALTPALAPLAMPARPAEATVAARPLPLPPGVASKRLLVGFLTITIVVLLGWAMLDGLLRDGFKLGDGIIFGLYIPNVAVNALAAATAIGGLFWRRRQKRFADVPAGWTPRRRTAVLIPARNEDTGGLGQRIRTLSADLVRQGIADKVDLFLLSDSDDPTAIAREERLALELAAKGSPRLYYRRRLGNEGRKPGNLANWLRQWGGHYGYMLVLDADSVMSARRIARLIRRMETQPRLGLIQAGIRLSGGESRFARLQQSAGRLYGGPFARGLAGWMGWDGNFWGHNALIRVKAFADAAGLPKLSGQAPFGGDILSHDFVEAAWLRRAGWGVELDPDSVGSAEGGPETVMEFHKRDRRWSQGNMQHLRLIRGKGLSPVSRLHFACGIMGYLASPLWLGLVIAAIFFGVSEGMLIPTLGAIGLVLLQKSLGVVDWLIRRPSLRTSRIVLRTAARELFLSTLIAPMVMMRQTVSVMSIFAGNDCGWKPAGGAKKRGDMRWLEPVAGLALIGAVMLQGYASPLHALIIAPIALPLLLAPLLTNWLDKPMIAVVEPAPVVEPLAFDAVAPMAAHLGARAARRLGAATSAWVGQAVRGIVPPRAPAPGGTAAAA